MRILMLNANLAGCGTYHRALWFARVCARHGHDATVCTVSPTSPWRRSTHSAQGVRVTEGPRWGFSFMPGHGSNWLDIAWRWREIRRGNYDVVYAFEYHPNVAWPVRLGLKPPQTLLSDWCDWYAGAANVFRGVRLLHAWDRRREDAIRRPAARVSVISSALQARALGLGIAPDRVHLIREGVDTDRMKPHDQAVARTTLGIPADARVVATLNDGHSFPLLVEAFAEARRRVPRALLLFVGAPSASQHELVARAGIADAFVHTGRCSDDDLPRLLAAADVYALPLADTLANRARFPHKIGDYLACGRATLLSRVGDYPELLREADAAVVAASFPLFKDELAALLDQPDRCRHYAGRGRAWVVRSLDWSVLSPAILAFVEGSGASAPPPLTSPG
jgi:glycosyltransferase involved in cell wall biosynthesis